MFDDDVDVGGGIVDIALNCEVEEFFVSGLEVFGGDGFDGVEVYVFFEVVG